MAYCAVLPSTLLSRDYHGLGLEDPYQNDDMVVDTIPINERFGDFISDDGRNPFDLSDPNIIKKEIEYDPISNSYLITERIGDEYFRAPTYMTFEEFIKWKQEKQQREYFAQLAGISRGDNTFNKRDDPLDRIDVSFNLVDRLFGGSTVDMRPQGNIDLTFGVDFQTNENPNVTVDQQRSGGFDFDMAIQMNLAGKIGTKLTMDVNYNTQSSFDFDRVLKIRYDASSLDPSQLLSKTVRKIKQKGNEEGEKLKQNARDRILGNTGDEIIKKIEAGNVSLPLRNSLIQGSQNLFGIKTELQFGRLRTTLVASQQKSEQQQLRLQGGAEIQEFEVRADKYDENRHFFLSHFNRETFEESLRDIPHIRTQFRITKIEVWVTNDRLDIENDRDIVLLADLGEFDRFNTASEQLIRKPGITNPSLDGKHELPSNDANLLYRRLLQGPRELSQINPFLIGSLGMAQSRDFEKVRGRLLGPTEFTVNNDLGFVSLNISTRPNQVIGVAYEYTYNGRVFQVGEFANEVPESPDSPGVHFVKMLKSTVARVDLPIWDLMMKNIYGIGAFQVTNEDFQLDFFYEDVSDEISDRRNLPNTNVSQFNLLELFNLDNLNFQRDPQPDGLFDFIPGLTINTRTGRIMIPLLEPFGDHLIEILDDDIEGLYAYPQLYDSTITVARDFTELNRFLIKGKYKSSISSDISLGSFNIPRGSVRVTAGGTRLVEGVDYEVDYNIGKVKILNDAYSQSGIPVNVSFEDNSLFSFQTKTMLGLRADYEVSENLNIGGTYLRLFERPFTQKVNIGEDPINNRVYGLDLNYSKEAPWLTRFVDKIPLLNTKEKSSIFFSAEAAALDPGHSSAINGVEDEGGVVYVDDFEGSASRIDLFSNPIAWTLASVPTDLGSGGKRYPESDLTNDRATGVNRAAMSWYRVDRFVVSEAERENRGGLYPYCRPLSLTELFDRSIANLFDQDLRTFDLNYRPSERGPYNYDVPDGTAYSTGADVIGNEVVLKDPKSRWGGIMRSIPSNTDFEASNVEFLEFWVLNPYIDKPDAATGKLIIQLGNISEDIQKDSRFFFENGLPVSATSTVSTSTTDYGIVPNSQPIVNAFNDELEGSRDFQDVGFDGLPDEQEITFFEDYLEAFDVGQNIVARDPSNDNFIFYNDPIYSSDPNVTCLERYSRHNFPEGDSPMPEGGTTTTQSQKSTPDIEDLDRDNTLNESESYYSYEVQLVNQNGKLSTDKPDRITDERQVVAYNSPGGTDDGVWYRFRIPLKSPDQVVGGIKDFRAIRFVRMYMTEFEEPVVLRFARLELTRSQWRRYELFEPCEGQDISSLNLEIDAVNIEENNRRSPFNYVLPEGIQQEQAFGALQTTLQNEQSLSLKTCNLPVQCEGVGAYKIIDFDFRLYDKLKMFIHAENDNEEANIETGDIELFIRVGSDLRNNYYEIIKPLTFSDYDAADRNTSENIWPKANNINVTLQDLIDIKTGKAQPSDSLKVVGLPNLADVKNIMIGLRSTSGNTSNQCIEVWANELRVTGLDEDGGIAALARAELQLADLGTVAASFNYSSIGYGSIDQPLVLRNRENVTGYDISANLELGKFLPKSSGVKIPFYVQHSVTKSTPQYDPFDEDVELSTKLAKAETASERDTISGRAKEYASITAINFTNVRKVRTNDKKSKPWHIENISLSYSNTKESRHDPIILQNEVNTRRIGLTYNYSRQGGFIKPFDKLIKSKKFLGLIKEFNFNPLPNTISFNTNLDRRFGETRFRSFSDRQYFNKYYTWDRSYALGWDFTRSLKFNYRAVNRAVVDEPDENELLRQYGADESARNSARNDSIWSSLKSFGRPKSFNQTIDISYTLPFKHIPYLDFIDARAQYSSGYNWDAASQNIEFLGNSIQNSQRRQLNSTIDLRKLYRKVDYLKKIEQKRRKTNKKKEKEQSDKDVLDPSGKGAPQKDKSQQEPNKEPTEDGKGKKGKKKKDGPREISTAERVLIRPLLSLRQIRFTYSRDMRSYVPGFTPDPEYFGLGEELTAPGLGYVFGIQPDREWLFDAAINEGWISGSEEQNQPFLLEDRKNYDLKVTLEPFKDFNIDLSWSKSERNTHTEIFKRINGTEWVANNPRDVGSYTVSYFMANTLFGRDINELFDEFSANRSIVSNMLGDRNGITNTHDQDGPLYREGYGRVQNDVVIPSFIAAYTGTDPTEVEHDVLKINPKPNWTLRWNGLTSIGFIGKVFSNFSLTHGYSSSLNINTYNSNFDYIEDQRLIFTESNKNVITQNFFSVLDIPNIDVRESFSPLIGINLTTKTGATIRFDYKKARNLALNLRESGELRESKSTDITFGFGHKIRNVNIGFLQIDGTGEKAKARKKRKKDREREKKKTARQDKDANNKSRKKQKKVGGSDLNIQVDISFRDDRTVVHELDTEGQAIDARGTKTLRVSPAIDYDINKNLNFRFFIDYSATDPYVSSSYRTTTTRGGINLRFKLN